MAVTVHPVHDGKLLALVLDIVEVAKVSQRLTLQDKSLTQMQSHSGTNLTEAFTNILKEFGVSNKVCCKKFELLPT